MFREFNIKLKMTGSIFQKFIFLMFSFFIFLLTSRLAGAQSNQLAQLITIEGRVFQNGIPVDANVDVKFEVYADGTPACTLFRDVHLGVGVGDGDPASKGFFNLQLGGGTTSIWQPGGSLTQIFSSRDTLTGDGCTVAPGSLTGRKRLVRISVKQAADPGYSILSEATELTSVPTAMVAETFQGLYPEDFYSNTVGPSAQTDLNYLVTNKGNIKSILDNSTNIQAVANGTSTKYVPVTSGAATLPPYGGSPASLATGQIWYDTASNTIRYKTPTGFDIVGTTTSGVSSITAGSGVTVAGTSTPTISIGTGAITSAMITDATIATGDLADSSVTNAKLATGIDASKISTGTLPAGVVPSGTDSTKLPLAGGTMIGPIAMGANEISGLSKIKMNSQSTVMLGKYNATQQNTLTTSTLAAADAGATWYNSATFKMMYWNGTTALEVSDAASAGDILGITTAAGSGLSGGATNGTAVLTVVTDGSSIQVNGSNQLEVKALGIASGKLAADAVTSAKVLDGTLVDADVNASAAIAWGKISKTGATAADVGAVPTTRSVNTNTGSGLSGGGSLAADRSLQVVVDGTSLEIATNTVQVKDGGITNAKINSMNITKLTAGAGDYFAYMPAGTECATGELLKWNATTDRWTCGTDATGVSAHNALTGLTADDHTQYVLLAGRTGGQNLRGGTASGDSITIESTSHATKGHVILQPTSGNVGIGSSTPAHPLDVNGNIRSSSSMVQYANATVYAGSGATASVNGATGYSVYNSNGINGGIAPLRMTVRNANALDQGAYIAAIANGGAATYSPTIVFGSQSGSATYSEKMRIDGSGNVAIGTTTTSNKLHVEGKINATHICSTAGTNCRDLAVADSAGTVTGVTAGTGLLANADTVSGGVISGSGSLTVDTGTTADKILKLNSSAQIPAVSGVLLTNLNAANLTSGTLATARLPIFSGGDVTTTAAGSSALMIGTDKVTGTHILATGTATGSFGSATHSATFTVDADGRLTAAGQTPITIGASQMPQLTGDVIMAANTTVTAINTGAVGTAEIADDAVTLAKLAGNAVNSASIVDASITSSDLAASVSGGLWTVSSSNVYRTGSVGIGGAPATGVKLDVNGQIVAGIATVPSGVTVNFINGNHQVLNAPGGPTLNLSNMVEGGSYTILITDGAARTYTLSGCSSTKTKPTGGIIATGGHTIITIMYMNSICYAAWSTAW